NNMQVVVYDASGLFGAARVWWTFRAFGVNKVLILDGGFPKWRSEGRPVEAGMVARTPTHFAAKFDAAMVADAARVQRVLAEGSAQVVEGRSAARFRAEAPEPREAVRSGHIPGSLSLPSSKVVAEGHLLPPAAIAAAAAEAGIDPAKPVITSCGSGVSAAVLW